MKKSMMCAWAVALWSFCGVQAQQELQLTTLNLPVVGEALKTLLPNTQDLTKGWMSSQARPLIQKPAVRQAQVRMQMMRWTYEKTQNSWKGTPVTVCAGSTVANVYDDRIPAEGEYQFLGAECSAQRSRGGAAQVAVYGVVRLLPEVRFQDGQGDRIDFVTVLTTSASPWWSYSESSNEIGNRVSRSSVELHLFNTAMGPETGDESFSAVVEFVDNAR